VCFLASAVPAVLGHNVGRNNTFLVWLGVTLDVGGILGVAVLLQVGRGSTPETWGRRPCLLLLGVGSKAQMLGKLGSPGCIFHQLISGHLGNMPEIHNIGSRALSGQFGQDRQICNLMCSLQKVDKLGFHMGV
jgi:hypothetical protein